MKALVTGAAGQLGRALIEAAPPDLDVIGLTRTELDIADPTATDAMIAREQPDLVVNAAAYTAVDRAEAEPEAAFRANRDGAANLAASAAAAGVRLVHLSTDFVFDGVGGRPYRPDDGAHPLGVYGASKLAGEEAVIGAASNSLIVRTAWVYGPTGGNFLATMLRLMAERPEVRVVCDQVGTPTSTLTLARALWILAARDEARGVLHLTDAGAASWYDFAVAIAEEALAAGLLTHQPTVTPITTADYPAAAVRPSYSVLDSTPAWRLQPTAPVHWRVALRAVLARMTPGP